MKDGRHIVENVIEELFRLSSSWIIEEVIKQSKEMALCYESSCNTVRLPAVLNKSGFHVFGVLFRTGRIGDVVDNAKMNGIFNGADAHTGIICSDGMDIKGRTYKYHPDSKIKFVGWQIPDWQDLLNLAEKIHRQIPEHKFVGWDFAHTDNGWVLIEGNWGDWEAYQSAVGYGIKEQWDELLFG